MITIFRGADQNQFGELAYKQILKKIVHMRYEGGEMSDNSHSPQSEEKKGFSCEWKPEDNKTTPVSNQNVIYTFGGDYTWEGVKPEAYKQKEGNFASIVRNVIIGDKGESCNFDLRYFEIMEGGFSSLEKHKHEHVVICVRGKGQVLMGKKIYDLRFLDTVYISPETPHQLINKYKEPFGFFCIVNRERDQPQEL